MEQIISTLTNPEDPNFWTALGVVVTALVALGGLLGWVLTNILNNRVSKTSKILIQAMIEIFLDWVKVKSKSQTVDDENIRIWISETGGAILTGRSYMVFKRFLKELKKSAYKDLLTPDENTYKSWVSKSDSKPTWERIDW
ncbi:hypothetical protein [Algoriphagus pacificus]|uniref:Uncharacterized protein n=1 Tax=Algoriphagus pacificus TaxID=2811234 RepID=A0ABS3CN99_9BACT|nr:hypothetical protein [Algoriphagus pacificus]MBN7817651.1 hypothetical protein [Algoriphagus pacificus]